LLREREPRRPIILAALFRAISKSKLSAPFQLLFQGKKNPKKRQPIHLKKSIKNPEKRKEKKRKESLQL